MDKLLKQISQFILAFYALCCRYNITFPKAFQMYSERDSHPEATFVFCLNSLVAL